MRTTTRAVAACLAATLTVLGVAACDLNEVYDVTERLAEPAMEQPAPSAPAPTEAAPAPQSSPPAADDDYAAARATLDTLEVKGRAPKANYDRDEFGPAWADIDRNGCDQRNDVLARDLTDLTFKPGTHDCVVLTGTLADPYTGTTIAFQRGQATSSAVQIDHVVALADAWQKGAQQWTPERRQEFANDPQNLRAVDGPANQQKGAGDAATWLPANKAHRCDYAATQVTVKSEYGLWVTQAEYDALARILDDC